MSQFVVYGRREVLAPLRAEFSVLLQDVAVAVLGLPPDKRFHRFVLMDAEDFPTPPHRSERYTIVEVMMFSGRTVATTKAFYAELFAGVEARLGIAPNDLEIHILETPRHDWGIRGKAGDDLALAYEIER